MESLRPPVPSCRVSGAPPGRVTAKVVISLLPVATHVLTQSRAVAGYPRGQFLRDRATQKMSPPKMGRGLVPRKERGGKRNALVAEPDGPGPILDNIFFRRGSRYRLCAYWRGSSVGCRHGRPRNGESSWGSVFSNEDFWHAPFARHSFDSRRIGFLYERSPVRLSGAKMTCCRSSGFAY
jgi:hypothetical protein